MSQERVLLVTGASSGFGEATARLFSSKGYQVAMAARRLERLDAIAQDIRQQGGQALSIQTDVTDLDDVRSLTEKVVQEFGRIDVLFNNAGFGRINWLENLDPIKDVKSQIEVNLLGIAWMAQAVLPIMISQRSGSIINMASMAAYVAPPMYTIYAATKFAVRGFTEALRREVRIHGIQVSALYPGGAQTEFNEVAQIKRNTKIKTPGFMVLGSQEVAEEVWKLANKPMRSRIIPWPLRLAAWGNILMPGFYDRMIENIFVKPERGVR